MKRQTRFKETEIGMIPADWDVKKLDEIKSSGHRAIAMGPFGSNIRKENYKEKGVPVIRGFNLKAERFLDENFVFLSEEKAEELAGSSSFPEDIIFVAQGGVGQVGIIPKDAKYKKYILSQNLMKISCDKERTDPFFIFYFFRSKKGQDEILSYVNPTGVPCISQPLSSLKLFRTPYPNIDEQHEIAKILLSLDEKIEINQKINLTIEKTGQALFRHWFIDFEFPNEKGMPYRSSGGKMVESDLGEIPKGWRVAKIGDEFKTVLGGTPSTTNKSYWENGAVAWINSGKINEFRITEPTAYITEEAVNNSATKLLPKGTTVLAITGATLGQVSRIEIDTCANQSVIGIIESETIHSEYIYFWIKHTIEEIIRHQTGGAQQHINKNNVNNSKILIPSEKVIQEYQRATKPIFDKISLACFEIKNISQIRDSLLPKLMSGKIRVPVEVK